MKTLVEHLGGWRGLLGVFFASGAVAIPVGLTVADVISKSNLQAGMDMPGIQLLSVVSLWLLVFAWALTGPDFWGRR